MALRNLYLEQRMEACQRRLKTYHDPEKCQKHFWIPCSDSRGRLKQSSNGSGNESRADFRMPQIPVTVISRAFKTNARTARDFPARRRGRAKQLGPDVEARQTQQRKGVAEWILNSIDDGPDDESSRISGILSSVAKISNRTGVRSIQTMSSTSLLPKILSRTMPNTSSPTSSPYTSMCG